jgi:hypothetical protein
MSRKIRVLLAALFLGVTVASITSTVATRIVHADEVDCTQDENKDKDECKK